MKTNRIILLFIMTILVINCKSKDNIELKAILIEDQNDRMVNNPETGKNDILRIKEVYNILDNEKLNTSNDYYNASMVLQHGEKTKNYKKANELAKKAVELDSNNKQAKQLIAQSMDRYLQSIDKLQIYGTQRVEIGNLEYLAPIDTMAISDNDRKKLNISTLKQKLIYFNKQHGKNETNIAAYFFTDSLRKIYFPEKRASLIGSLDELFSKIKYPKKALKNKISGDVLVEYTIDKDGYTKNIIVTDGLGYGCDEEAIRVISLAKFKNYMKKDIERRIRIPFKIEY